MIKAIQCRTRNNNRGNEGNLLSLAGEIGFNSPLVWHAGCYERKIFEGPLEGEGLEQGMKYVSANTFEIAKDFLRAYMKDFNKIGAVEA